MVQAGKNIPYYLAAVGIFILLKFAFTLADNSDLIFLLKPTNEFVSLLTSSDSVYLSDSGYYHHKLNILIDKSCAGFNFWVLCFLVFTYLALRYDNKHISKILTLPLALIGAYLITIFVNTSRIFVSIFINAQTPNFLLDQQSIIHETIGVINNFSFLILAYLLIEKFLIHNRRNAKFA